MTWWRVLNTAAIESQFEACKICFLYLNSTSGSQNLVSSLVMDMPLCHFISSGQYAAQNSQYHAVSCIQCCLQVDTNNKGVQVGAGITLSDLEHVLRSQIKSQPSHKTRGFAAAAEQLRWFAGRQIRNVGTLGGNIATASPISDLNPLWMAFGAVFTVVGQGTGVREIPASKFFLGYRWAYCYFCVIFFMSVFSVVCDKAMLYVLSACVTLGSSSVVGANRHWSKIQPFGLHDRSIFDLIKDTSAMYTKGLLFLKDTVITHVDMRA